ncbi:MAG: SRPBCC family protein [Betaproteobacteria bacterium]|nr:SRPBCC family protein [Betaproteobacteria bacterium]
MKKILALIALSITTSLASLNALAHGPSPLKVDKSITIKAEPAKVWALIKDFGNMQKWHPAITNTKLEKKGEDTFRTLTLKDGGTIVEKLRGADDNDMKIRYEITSSQLPLTDYNSFMVVTKGAKPGETNVQWVGRFYRLYKLNPPIPAGQDDETALNVINGIFDSGLDGLQKAAESSK